MAIKIVIKSPYYKKDGECEIRAKIECSEIAANSEIRIVFSELEQFANASSQKALDFFFISSFVYGIDRFVERRTYSVDGWSREMNVTFPVYEVSLWNTVKATLEKALSFLTGDYWTVSFVKNEFQGMRQRAKLHALEENREIQPGAHQQDQHGRTPHPTR